MIAGSRLRPLSLRYTVHMKRLVRMSVTALSSLALLFGAAPGTVFAAQPFGGQASQVIPCYNQVIFVSLGPPNGGPFVWSPRTRTYQFGPPSHAGQWFLGLAGAISYCIITYQPFTTVPGSEMLMMGSSQ